MNATREELVAWAHRRANELAEMKHPDAAKRAARVGMMLEADAKALSDLVDAVTNQWDWAGNERIKLAVERARLLLGESSR